MSPLKLAIPLVACVVLVSACDGSDTVVAGKPVPSSTGNSAADSTNGSWGTDQSAPVNDRRAPMPNDQRAPMPVEQQAPSSSSGVPGSGSGTGASNDCMAICQHVIALGCSDTTSSDDCAKSCQELAAAGSCQSVANSLFRCAANAVSCDALEGCSAASSELNKCLNGSSSSSSSNSSSSSSGSCSVANNCSGCTSGSCEQCTCALEISGYSSSEAYSLCCG